MLRKFKIIFIVVVFLSLPSFISAAFLGEKTNFYIDSTFDLPQREEISATLQFIGSNLYLYTDDAWWKLLDSQEKSKIMQSFQNLNSEFYYKIYPTLISIYGSEWKPGIDKDYHITILVHPMIETAGGYFNSGDEYFKLENPKSNEREMVYLNANYINSSLAKSLLAHEFTHLITFNQKEKIQGSEEEVWLNEARAEYASTLMGYDAEYEGSNLEKRVKTFLENPSDSITEWQGREADYGGLNLFIQYLVEQYGTAILTDSLKSEEVGIKSLNYALEKNGFDVDFSQVFTDWTIAISANDCSLGEKYCYKNENLKNLRIMSSINFLPLKGKSTLGVNQTTKNWSGNWFKFIGGKGILKIEFIGNPENLFKVPYLAKNITGEYSLDFFELNEYQRGEISVPGFGSDITFVTIIPTIQSKMSGFLSIEPSFPFFWEASTIVEIEETEENLNSKYLEKPLSKMTKTEILDKISDMEELISQLKAQLVKIIAEEETEEVSCEKFDKNLFYGLNNNSEVKCLQEFLKNQGKDIYPEELVTGNFLTLTKAAVVRFQEKYKSEILEPLELEKGTGFVGKMTRAKINDILTREP